MQELRWKGGRLRSKWRCRVCLFDASGPEDLGLWMGACERSWVVSQSEWFVNVLFISTNARHCLNECFSLQDWEWCKMMEEATAWQCRLSKVKKPFLEKVWKKPGWQERKLATSRPMPLEPNLEIRLRAMLGVSAWRWKVPREFPSAQSNHISATWNDRAGPAFARNFFLAP